MSYDNFEKIEIGFRDPFVADDIHRTCHRSSENIDPAYMIAEREEAVEPQLPHREELLKREGLVGLMEGDRQCSTRWSSPRRSTTR